MNTQGMIPLKENDSKKISYRYQKKTYAKGATCIYGDTLYRAKADITTAEEWTAAHWEETNMETIRAEMAAEVSSLNARLNIKYIDRDYPSIYIDSAGYGIFDTTAPVPGGTIIAATILTWDSGSITGGIALGISGRNYGYVFGSANQTVSGLKVRFLYID